jgi:hypothetical protein
MVKRKKLIDSPASPTIPPNMDNSALSIIMAKLDIMGAQLTAQLAKSEQLETSITNLRADMAVVVNASAKKDEIISRHTEQINNCEQALRSTSIRILGLPVKKDDNAMSILNTVYDTILHPVLVAAEQKGELDAPFPSRRFLIDSAFAIPAKNPASCPVIVKFSSAFVRNLVFSYKNDSLPKMPDPISHRMRPKFAIYEDLTPANFAHLRSLTEDPRTTTIWTFNGMVKFRVKDSEVIYRSRSLTDTVDSILKIKPAHPPAP